MAVLGYLPKRSLGLDFAPHFLHDLIIYHWKKFQYHTFFPSQDIKQNKLLRSSLDN